MKQRSVGFITALVKSFLIKIGLLTAAGSLPDSAGGGTVQGEDETYDLRLADDGSFAADARGVRSVDFNSLRYASDQVASGQGSAILGGEYGKASGDHSAVVGGQFNFATDKAAFVGAGQSNVASGDNAFVGAGRSGEAKAEGCAIVGGDNNTIDSNCLYSFIGAGKDNRVNSGATFGAILAANLGDILGTAAGAVLLSGQHTQVTWPHSVVQGIQASLADQGFMQRVSALLWTETTDHTQTELFIGSSGLAYRLELDDDDAYSGKMSVFAKRDNGDWARWNEVEFTASRDGSGNVVMVGGYASAAPDVYGNASGVSNGSGSAWRIVFDENTTDQAIRVRFTGTFGQNIRSIATFDLSRINY